MGAEILQGYAKYLQHCIRPLSSVTSGPSFHVRKALGSGPPYDKSGSTVLLVHPRAIFSILAANRDNTAADRSSAYRTRKSAEVSQKFTKFCELSRVWHVYAIYVFTPKSARICDTFRIS